MKSFHLTIARVGESLYSDETVSAVLPGSEGVFTLLPGHEPFVSDLAPGEIRVERASGERLHFEVPQTGVVEVSGNQATVLL